MNESGLGAIENLLPGEFWRGADRAVEAEVEFCGIVERRSGGNSGGKLVNLVTFLGDGVLFLFGAYGGVNYFWNIRKEPVVIRIYRKLYVHVQMNNSSDGGDD